MVLLLLLLFVIALWFLFWEWRRVARRRRLLGLLGRVRDANDRFDDLIGDQRYFAHRDEVLFLEAYDELRGEIGSGFERLGLEEDVVEMLGLFCGRFEGCGVLRAEYNEGFVRREAERYAGFFAGLEDYPLSGDQVEAVIRDEDNNLVIAGAGTGKTTTISAKVAYVLEKGLARPEELLVISFTNNAVREMRERCLRFCRHIPGAEALEVRTFNSFGFLVSRTCSDRELLLAFDGDDEAAKAFLQKTFEELFRNDGDFRRKAVNYLAFFERSKRDEDSFKTRDEYLTYEQGFKNVTLDGVKVNSKEEVEIGNFFCLYNIKYEYQRHYPLKEEDRNANYGAYQPDFYLPDQDLWHEHFGIRRDGSVPDWFGKKAPYQTPTEYYQAGMAWKEGIHAKYGTKLIKTYSYEAHEGTLPRNLKEKLTSEGVELIARSSEELLELFKETEQYQDCMNLIYTFLGLMKSNGKRPEELEAKKGDKRFKVFLQVFAPLFAAYDKHLKSIPAVDYNDMVNDAAEHFRQGRFTRPYKYILVDEFQDMFLGRYELIKAIRKQNPSVKLYAVGDDWQSIFRFTGSDISIITQFQQHFGFTSQTAILQTYRFNEQILAASSNFIQQNPAQIKKQLTTHHKAPEGHTSFEFNSRSVAMILEKIAAQKVDALVFLIGRYKFNCPKNLPELRHQFAGLRIAYFTAHSVKGMTCDYAILLDINSGILGFPSEMADDPMLSYLLQEGDTFENAEERRVCYVAITRARYKNYLLYNESRPSKFISELQGTDSVSNGKPMPTCPECQATMIKRKGPYSEFYGCIHYPACNGKASMAIQASIL